MIFSRQFRALARIAVSFAAAWGVVGSAIAVLARGSDPDNSLLAWVATHALMFGAVGAISGLVSGLVLARAEAGRRVEHLATWRIAAWGVIGGLAPSLLFGLLGLVFGAPASSYVPLAILGLVSAGTGGAFAASAVAVAKRTALVDPEETPRLPAA